MRISDWSSYVCSSDLPDAQRGWGRAAVASDYVYDSPHQLGTMRTGPDLLNVGARLPSRDWHLTHLYQPRAIFGWSIMPAYPYLFEVKERADPGDVVISLPEDHAPHRSEEHTSELQSLMRISYAVFCLKKQN